MKNNLFILLGPSASGKSRLQKMLELPKIVTTTTRSMRLGEQDGVDYHFVTLEKFQAKRESGDFVEWTTYGGSFYATDRERIEESLSMHPVSCIVLDHNGAKRIKALWPDQVMIIGVYALKAQIEQRLLARNDQQFEKRLSRYEDDIREMLELSDLIFHSDDSRSEALKEQIEGFLIKLSKR